MSMIPYTKIPSSFTSKIHLAIGYHRVRKAIVCGILRLAHISSVQDIA